MKVLTVTKGGHTMSYDITAGFTDAQGNNVPQLTDEDFAELDEETYYYLKLQFIEYVCSQEDGLAEDCPDLTTGSEVFDPVSCPLTLQTENER